MDDEPKIAVNIGGNATGQLPVGTGTAQAQPFPGGHPETETSSDTDLRAVDNGIQ